MKTKKRHSPASKYFTRGEKVGAKPVKHHGQKHGGAHTSPIKVDVLIPDKRDDELSDIESLDREERGSLVLSPRSGRDLMKHKKRPAKAGKKIARRRRTSAKPSHALRRGPRPATAACP